MVTDCDFQVSPQNPQEPVVIRLVSINVNFRNQMRKFLKLRLIDPYKGSQVFSLLPKLAFE